MRWLIRAVFLLGSGIGTPAIAEQISLVCSGTWNLPTGGKNQVFDSTGSMIIDLEKESVQSSWGAFAITNIKPNFIGMVGYIPATDKMGRGEISGGIDRLSGELSLTTSFDGGKTIVGLQQYKCSKAKAIF